MIPEEKLIEFGATLKKYYKGDRIIKEGQKAVFYYQIASGNVKMNNFNESGKEFIQGMFSAPESFGEPPYLLTSPILPMRKPLTMPKYTA